MVGPPRSGKTMLAKRVPTILRELTAAFYSTGGAWLPRCKADWV
jgi:hypothetical protein